jgi:hypothetical protein
VTITLSGTDSLGNSVSRTTVTSSTGLYFFGSVSAGSYETLVNTSTLGTLGVNFQQTYDIDGTGSVSRASFALTAGQNRTSVNYGYQLLSTLSGIVWLDPNSSGGSPEVGETGFNGVTVTLSGVDALGNSVSRTMATSSTGYYSFGNLLSGSYMTLVTKSDLPGGGVAYGATYDYDGITTLEKASVSIVAGQNVSGVNYGYSIL